jgi:fatty-acid desaturase
MNKYFYLAFFPLHLFFLFSLFNFSIINWWLVLILWVMLSGYGVGVTLHRLLSHRAFNTYNIVKNTLSVISCFCVQGSPIFWVTIHRGYHHRYSDTNSDIHSPIHGRWWAYFLWTCKIKSESISYKYVPDLLRSKLQLWLSKYYFYVLWCGWVISYFVSIELFLSLIIAQIITLHSEFFVNLFCHIRGIPGSYRNFDTKDNSQNYWLFGIVCWGIGYHNNHHHKPQDFNFGHHRLEFDPTTVLISLLPKINK